jgi:hypothetical protein
MTELPQTPNLEGKTVAVVGPAVPLYDQCAEVEACDFIIRCNYRWNGYEQLEGYGERTDAAFYSCAGSRAARDNPSAWENLPYVILKQAGVHLSHPRVIQTKNPFDLANQVPILLHWLEGLKPAEIHVFGADFYTSGYTGSTVDAYLPDYNPVQYWKDIQTHDQSLQHKWIKAFQERTGLIKGDSRMVELLSISTEEVVARLNEAWKEYRG